MAQAFPGVPKEFFPFLKQLKKNNDREWFAPRKATFEDKLKGPMEELVGALNASFAKFAPEYITEPKKAMYRIYRDTRFSSDKTPYKTHLGAFFFGTSEDKEASAGYYFQLAPDEIGIAGGIYAPSPENLFRIRTHIAEHYQELEKLLANKKLRAAVGELQGSTLTRPPKGFPKDHPADKWLRRKSFHFWDVSLPVEVALTPKIVPEIAKRFELMAPVVAFLRKPLAARKGDPLAMRVDFD